MTLFGAPIEGGPASTLGIDTATGFPTGISATTINTKGAWVELIAATTYESAWIEIVCTHTSGAGRFSVDIGIGAAASEVVVLPDYGWETRAAGGRTSIPILVPLRIPAGSRVSARMQSTLLNATCKVNVILIAPTLNTNRSPDAYTGYGFDTAISGGQIVDPGAVAHTKGAWTEITASSTGHISTLIVFAQGYVNNLADLDNWLVDVGVGGAGSEQVIIDNLWYYCEGGADLIRPNARSFPVRIPAGSRIALRCQSTRTTTTGRYNWMHIAGA